MKFVDLGHGGHSDGDHSDGFRDDDGYNDKRDPDIQGHGGGQSGVRW